MPLTINNEGGIFAIDSTVPGRQMIAFGRRAQMPRNKKEEDEMSKQQRSRRNEK